MIETFVITMSFVAVLCIGIGVGWSLRGKHVAEEVYRRVTAQADEEARRRERTMKDNGRETWPPEGDELRGSSRVTDIDVTGR